MPDNLNIKGIEDDVARGKFKPRGGKRKLHLIESRVDPPEDPLSVYHSLPTLLEWSVWGRYSTSARRDQAYAALVKKNAGSTIPTWARWAFRKVDP